MTWWMEERFKMETPLGVLLDDFPELHTHLFFYMPRHVCEQYRDLSVAEACSRAMLIGPERLLEMLNSIPVLLSRDDP